MHQVKKREITTVKEVLIHIDLTILLLRLVLSFIKHSRQYFIGYPNTSNFVKNTPRCVLYSTLFSVFGYPDERCLWCLIYYFQLFVDVTHVGVCHIAAIAAPSTCSYRFPFFVAILNSSIKSDFVMSRLCSLLNLTYYFLIRYLR